MTVSHHRLTCSYCLQLFLHTCFKYIISCFESCELKLTLLYGLTHYQEHVGPHIFLVLVSLPLFYP
ncbi:hypothetical protein HanPI659440_Chr10g0361221 [Helianthus annuus]|nr:hypothetical protein HanPI659440_Chr10g0361221 [Helianthus annuus]